MQIVLASSSTYRAELLARLGLPFETVAPAVDELPLAGESAVELVRRLAQLKAEAVAGDYQAALIIGSDQVALFNEQILGKPGSVANARAQLAILSGGEVCFLTSLCLLNSATGHIDVTVVETEVRFRQLTEAQIKHYVDREMPLDCAGAFKSEGLGITLFASVGGHDPSALIGLPLIELCSMLAGQGVAVLNSET